jgi:hypothetical protein
MGKTSKLLRIAVIAGAVIFLLSACDNPAMEPNKTEYMYSDLSIEKAVWEVIPDMTMTDMYITIAFDEPVRAERDTATNPSPWRPFTVSFDYNGPNGTTPPVNPPRFPDTFPVDRGNETAVYRFSLMVKDGDTSDMFSNVRLSYTAPPGFKILTAFDDELKNFGDKPVTKKETDGMGGH